jgi:3-deoxy-D-manno-octulosonic-acid transferase
MTLALYSVIGFLLTPFLHLWFAKRAARGKEDPARKGERFGYASVARPPGTLIWLHAASVGEAQSVLTLVRELLQRDSKISLLITTGTVTSAQLIAHQQLPRTIHQFTPADTPCAVKRFLDHWQPNLALWVESEFWPQLLIKTHARRIPLLLINARLSAHSFERWQRWPRSIKRILACFDTIYAGSPDDAARLKTLGARNVIEAGNLKFDAATLTVDAASMATLQAQISDRPCWLAASTHANEEQLIARQHRLLREAFPSLLTIIVPRHAMRGGKIAAILRDEGFRLAQRSTGDAVSSNTEIYLADSMGELGSFYQLAPIVFLGGSLIAHGGHNPLEPARQDCAILSGPHVHNFAPIMQQLADADALRIVADADQLGDAVRRLLGDATTTAAMATRAKAQVAQAGGASRTILARIDQLLKEPA